MGEAGEGGDEAPGDTAGRVLGWAPAPCLRPPGQRHLGATRLPTVVPFWLPAVARPLLPCNRDLGQV